MTDTLAATDLLFRDPLDCRDCPRLAAHLAALREQHPDWHALPVPSFGPMNARLLVVGLAPGEKGANRTGRPFSGDIAGELLYPTLFACGFASHPEALDAQGQTNPQLVLHDCRICNAVRCLPPANKPLTEEIQRCNPHLQQELNALQHVRIIVALGGIAHKALCRAYQIPAARLPFAHHARHPLPDGRLLIDSYHCSGYNWRTGRLSRESFMAVFQDVQDRLNACA